jgi:hypothetical protein
MKTKQSINNVEELRAAKEKLKLDLEIEEKRLEDRFFTLKDRVFSQKFIFTNLLDMVFKAAPNPWKKKLQSTVVEKVVKPKNKLSRDLTNLVADFFLK